MSTQELELSMARLASTDTGILAADESTSTIGKRFDAISLENTEEHRRAYREMLFTTPHVEQFISGVILFEETLRQSTKDGTTFSELLMSRGILPGIKLDAGLVDLANADGEKVTAGIDSLEQRLIDNKALGAKFAKWRAVFTISDTLPSHLAINTNANLLARYAALCQKHGIVPIVEPEVLMDGDHTIDRCMEVTEHVLMHVFEELHRNKVSLEHMVLKPNMVVPGNTSGQKMDTNEVAQKTLTVLRRTVPAAVPAILFLSGGQSEQQATANLDAINKLPQSKPWVMSYSYGRALQASSINAWEGKDSNVEAAQHVLYKRSKLNSAASIGKYDSAMEHKD